MSSKMRLFLILSLLIISVVHGILYYRDYQESSKEESLNKLKDIAEEMLELELEEPQ